MLIRNNIYAILFIYFPQNITCNLKGGYQLLLKDWNITVSYISENNASLNEARNKVEVF